MILLNLENFCMKLTYYLLIISICVLNGCKKNPVSDSTQAKLLMRQYAVMGGIILKIKFYNNGELEHKAMKAAYAKVIAVDKACNIYNPESEISRLNSNAYDKPFKCSTLLWNILIKSKEFYELSGGAFDISSAPLMALWGFHRKRKTLPSQKEINAIKKRIGLNKVIFNHTTQSIKFKVKGMKLDLGGIAKGYAVVLAANAAKQCGVKTGLINLSGNAYCFPQPPPGKNTYIVGVQHPRDKTAICGTINLLNQSVATSGDYERYVLINGQKFAHIMNPVTGIPVENMLSVTVVTPNAIDSDALSTAIFIKGAKFAEKITKKINNTNVLIIYTEKNTNKTKIIRIGNIWNKCHI